MTVSAVAVVIPARNEEICITSCVQSVLVAGRRLAAALPDIAVRIVVVLDRCTDRTGELIARFGGVETLVSRHGRVGAARALGVRHVLRCAGIDPAAIWIACTDADSVVPPGWLVDHLELSRDGAELVLGTVRPDPAELSESVHAAWLARHRLADGHHHVHGANLGIRGDSYLRAGGFDPVTEHEDVRLAARVLATGARISRTARSPVLTSARTIGRTPAGMAGYLRELDRAQVDREVS